MAVWPFMETEVDGLTGAGRQERTAERSTYRNGYRDRTPDTRPGSLQLRIRKLRQGSYFPPFLEPRRTPEKALVAVIHRSQERSIHSWKDDGQEAIAGRLDRRRLDQACR